jgi:hypothetical protein
VRLGRDNTEDPRVVHDLDVLSEQYGADRAAAPASPPPAEVRGGRTRLRRDNTEDPRVLHDLAVLGRTYGADEAVLAEVGAAAEPAPAPVDPGPMADPFVRRFVGASVHVKRYAGLYAGTLAWVVVMLLAAPHHRDAVPAQQAAFAGTPAAARSVAPSSPSGAAAATTGDAASSALAAPSGYDFGSSDVTSSELADPTDATFSSPTTSDGASSSSSSSSSTSETFSTTDDASSSSDAAPAKLTIVRSGYASNTAGTPVEQAPANGGLPVAAAGGQASKRSFIALGGGGTVLHLAVATDPGANVGDDRASISACPILKPGWEATRGQAMPGPEFTQPCATGVRQSDGSWTFDLSAFGDPTKAAGFALTPDPSDAAETFQVTFVPKAL